MLKLTSPLLRAAALAALVGNFAFIGSAQAATPVDPDQNAVDQAPAEQPESTMAPHNTQASPAKGHRMMAEVEKRIRTLHDKLKITQDQQADWDNVAETMRDNESTLVQLIHARHQNPENMSAIDDLQSYQAIAQAHADGLQKMITAFKALYGDMSADQQKNADEVFGRFEGHSHAKESSNTHHG